MIADFMLYAWLSSNIIRKVSFQDTRRMAGSEFYKLSHKIFINHIYETTNFFVGHSNQLIPAFLQATVSAAECGLACDQMFKSLPRCYSCQGALVKN